MIALAVIAAIVTLVCAGGISWYFDSRPALILGLVLAGGVVAGAVELRPAAKPRTGIAVGVDDSCDAPRITSDITSRLHDTLTPGIDGNAAVLLSLFSSDARSSRHVLLDLSSAPPADISGDTVGFTNWKAARAADATKTLAGLRTSPCKAVGTSIIGAAEAAQDMLDDAEVKGPRTIVLVTNLIEFSSDLRIDARRFAPKNVAGAVRAIAKLPVELRPALAPNTTVEILFTPVVRVHELQLPLADDTAVALEAWAQGVFRTVLHASDVKVTIVDQPS